MAIVEDLSTLGKGVLTPLRRYTAEELAAMGVPVDGTGILRSVEEIEYLTARKLAAPIEEPGK